MLKQSHPAVGNPYDFIQSYDSHFYKWEWDSVSASVGVDSPTEDSMFSFS